MRKCRLGQIRPDWLSINRSYSRLPWTEKAGQVKVLRRAASIVETALCGFVRLISYGQCVLRRALERLFGPPRHNYAQSLASG